MQVRPESLISLLIGEIASQPGDLGQVIDGDTRIRGNVRDDVEFFAMLNRVVGQFPGMRVSPELRIATAGTIADTANTLIKYNAST